MQTGGGKQTLKHHMKNSVTLGFYRYVLYI